MVIEIRNRQINIGKGEKSMISKSGMVLSTTSNLSNYAVLEYVGVVSARVVAGTTIFADFSASIIDFLGGGSKAYNNTLKYLHNHVIEELEGEALKLSANGIIGIRIDHDEISGGGKQMFMVNATGTAVMCNKIDTETQVNNIKNAVMGHDVQFEVEKRQICDKLNNSEWDIYDKGIWSILIKNRVHEATPYVIKRIDKYIKDYNHLEEIYMADCVNFFRVNSVQESVEELYEALINSSGVASSIYLKIIVAADIIDYKYISLLLNSQNIALQKQALANLTVDKKLYYREDIRVLEEICSTIKNDFPDKNASMDDKGQWECQCGKMNRGTDVYCVRCYKDVHGLEVKDVKPEEILRLLNNRIDVLKSLFPDV